MYDRMNEDAAWQRVQDIQREMENSRLLASNGFPTALETLGRLGARAWLLANLVVRRQPRHRPARKTG